MGPAGRTSSLARWIAVVGLTVAIACVLAAVVSGLGHRAGLWHFRTGFLILRYAFFTALAAAAVSLLGALLSRGARSALVPGIAGLAIGLAFAYVPWQWKQTADALPYIHDITTDTDNPPQFVAAAALRKEGDHPVAYDGAEVAAQQKKAYPDIAPLVTAASKEKVYAAAKRAIESMHLTLTGSDPAAGRLEASHTSFWYGFTDDFVVRISETAGGTRLDVRSKSRVGRSDLGQNAKRIRAFMEELKAELG
jgi:uncharacterized protein (DUF1499 family)